MKRGHIETHETIDARIKMIKSLLPRLDTPKEEKHRIVLSDVRPHADEISTADIPRQVEEGYLAYALILDPGDIFESKPNFLSQSISLFSNRWEFEYGQMTTESHLTTNGYLLGLNRIVYRRDEYPLLDESEFFKLMITFFKLGLSGQIGMSVTYDDKDHITGSFLWLDDGHKPPRTLQALWFKPKVKLGKTSEIFSNVSGQRVGRADIKKLCTTADIVRRLDPTKPLSKDEAAMATESNGLARFKNIQSFGFAFLALGIVIQLGRLVFEDEVWFLYAIFGAFALLAAYGLIRLRGTLMELLLPTFAGFLSMAILTAVPTGLYFSLVDADDPANDTMTLIALGSFLLLGIAGFLVTYFKLCKRFEDKLVKELQS